MGTVRAISPGRRARRKPVVSGGARRGTSRASTAAAPAATVPSGGPPGVRSRRGGWCARPPPTPVASVVPARHRGEGWSMATTSPAHELVWQRMAVGKAARDSSPRSAYAKWRPAADRPDPVAVLEGESATRVPELVPIRYGRMLVSPFTFFRGGAALMAGDIGPLPNSGLRVQLCGDAHLSNFGAFASPERSLVFDINDFDETAPGPFEWDVARLAASFAVAGRDRGLAGPERKAVIRS